MQPVSVSVHVSVCVRVHTCMHGYCPLGVFLGWSCFKGSMHVNVYICYYDQFLEFPVANL